MYTTTHSYSAGRSFSPPILKKQSNWWVTLWQLCPFRPRGEVSRRRLTRCERMSSLLCIPGRTPDNVPATSTAQFPCSSSSAVAGPFYPPAVSGTYDSATNYLPKDLLLGRELRAFLDSCLPPGGRKSLSPPPPLCVSHHFYLSHVWIATASERILETTSADETFQSDTQGTDMT